MLTTTLFRLRPTALRPLQSRTFQPFAAADRPGHAGHAATPNGYTHIPNTPHNSPVHPDAGASSNVRILPFTEDIEEGLRRDAQRVMAAESGPYGGRRKTTAEERDEEIARRLEEHVGGVVGRERRAGPEELARELEFLKREVENTAREVRGL